jgi:hypothetical protein
MSSEINEGLSSVEKRFGGMKVEVSGGGLPMGEP